MSWGETILSNDAGPGIAGIVSSGISFFLCLVLGFCVVLLPLSFSPIPREFFTFLNRCRVCGIKSWDGGI